MMKHKHGGIVFLIVLIFILGSAIAVFFIGWVQFRVPADKVGVVVSKTGGVDPLPLVSGHFRWHWEALLPTNPTLYVYDTAPIRESFEYSDTLPSAEVYSPFLTGKPDFSYRFTCEVVISVESDKLPGFVSAMNAFGEEEYKNALKDCAKKAAEIVRSVLAGMSSDSEKIEGILTGEAESINEIIREAEKSMNGAQLERLSVLNAKIPDIKLYRSAQSLYLEFLKAKGEALDPYIGEEAAERVSEELRLDLLERYGILFQKYPILLEYLAIENRIDPKLFELIKTGKTAEPD